MDEETRAKRVKVTSGAAHQVGTKRAAVKPHKRETAPSVKQIISEALASIKATSLSQTYTGETLTKNAAVIRAGFGLAASDELFLLNDPTGTGKAGMCLSTTGVTLADGRGGSVSVPWADFAKTTVGYQRGMLVIGQNAIVSKDAQAMATLLQQVQTKLNK